MDSIKGLKSIRGVGQITADRLRSAGYDSFEKLAAASPEQLKEEIGLNINSAENIISAAGQMREEMRRSVGPDTQEEPLPLEEEPASEEPMIVFDTQKESSPPEEEPAQEEVTETPEKPSLMENLAAEIVNSSDGMYILTGIAEQIASSMKDVPDISKKILEEAMNKPDFRATIISRTVERVTEELR